MRVAALYDIHGNLPALRAVLASAAGEGIDRFVIGGDVAAGPMPRETIEQLAALGDRARFVRGNADREIVEGYRGRGPEADHQRDPLAQQLDFITGRISHEHRKFLASFAPTVELDVSGLGPVLFCHGSPRSDSESVTTLTSEARLREILTAVDQPIVVCGHTHRQFDHRIDGWRVVNAGSVGMPYEGRPGAYWATLGPDIELRHTEYDLEEAVAEMRAAAFPQLEEMLEASLLRPADPDEVSEFFERQATRGS